METRRPASPPVPAHFGSGLSRSRRSPTGPLVSLVLHLLLVVLVVRVGPELAFRAPAGDLVSADQGGGGGGGGGRAVQMVALQAPRTAPPPPLTPARPPAVVESPAPEPPIPEPVLAAVDTAPQQADSGEGRGTGSGTGEGTGRGSGSGSGAGAGSGSGVGAGRGPGTGGGGTARPPEPRQLILPPPDVPGGLRGTSIAVTFQVSADGRVLGVAFNPEPPDRGFARKLEDVMRNYRFRPARSAEGLAVPGTTTVTLTF